MINPLFYSNCSPVAQTSFGNKKIKPQTLKDSLNEFSNQLSNIKSSFVTISKENIAELPTEVTAIELQFIKPYNQAVEKTLNLSVKTKTSEGESLSQKTLKKGPLPEIREYLRTETTPAVITEEVKNLAKGSIKESDPYGF